MDFPDKRGQHRSEVAEHNRLAIYNFFAEHPEATQKDACDILGLSGPTVRAHMRAIEDGWTPGNA